MKAMFARDLRSLRPAGTDAEELLRMIKLGDIVEVEVRRRRNPRHHRKWWVLMQIVVDNCDGRWPSADALCDAIKVAIGHTEPLITITGEVMMRPKSINFASMDQVEFQRFYARAIDLIVTDVLPGIDKPALDREVEAMIAPYHGGWR